MNREHDNLEAEIERALKELPPLAAPGTLAARVMKVVEARATLRWYQQPWPKWPRPLRAGSFIVLLVLFALLSFGVWRWLSPGTASLLQTTVGNWVAAFGTFRETIAVLWNAAILSAKHLGTGFIVACLIVAAFSYFACVGLGTVAVRLALSKR